MSRFVPTRVGRQAARLVTLSVLLAGALASSARAQGSADSTPYLFSESSQYSWGCFGPCACPVTSVSPLSGSFDLRLIDSDPLFRHYAVENLSAQFPRQGGYVRVTGQGEYRIGGEVALMHQMRLDLVIDGSEVQFDSGLVPGGGSFPGITIEVAANGFACHDTVIGVVAKPATADIPDPGTGLARAVPNPFHTEVELHFAAAAEPGLVEILDLQGRTVSSIGPLMWIQAPGAPHILRWDGLASDGTHARPGVYFVRARLHDREWRQRIVKLE